MVEKYSFLVQCIAASLIQLAILCFIFAAIHRTRSLVYREAGRLSIYLSGQTSEIAQSLEILRQRVDVLEKQFKVEKGNENDDHGSISGA